jgi:predicted glutamine amidotransferase
MHNGELGAYRAVMRRLRHELPEDLYFSIRGSTDSEHAFAVIQDHLGEPEEPSTVDLVEAVRSGLAYLEDLKEQVGEPEATTEANLCLTDGSAIVATRFAHPEDLPAQSLSVGQAGGFRCGPDGVAAEDPEGDDAVLVASERLFDDDRVWDPVERNHLLVVDHEGAVWTEPLGIA